MGKAEFVTGIFIIVAIACVTWLAIESDQPIPFAAKGGSEFVAYFDDVGLLAQDSRVVMNGKKVGQVGTLVHVPRVGEKGGEEYVVQVKFEVDDSVAGNLRSGTRAEISQESLLGAKLLKIVPRLDGPALPVDPITELPVLEATSYSDLMSTFGQLKEKLQPLLDSTAVLVKKVNDEMLSPDNVRKIKDMLLNVDGLVVDLRGTVSRLDTSLLGEAGTMSRLDRLLDSTTAATDKLPSVFDDLQETIRVLQEQTAKTLANADRLMTTTNGAVANVDDMMQRDLRPRLNDVLDQATRATTNADRQLTRLGDNVEVTLEDARGFMANRDLTGSLYELRQLLRELKLLSVSLRADPSQLVWGGPGEAVPATSRERDESDERSKGRPVPYGY